MQEPFCSIPLIRIISEDTVAKRLPFYSMRKWVGNILFLIGEVLLAELTLLVFPDFSLPVNLPSHFLDYHCYTFSSYQCYRRPCVIYQLLFFPVSDVI